MKLQTENIWITSDLHLGHNNIVSSVSNWKNKKNCRDFSSVNEMNQIIISNINAVVKENDFLINLGDLSLNRSQHVIKHFIESINCKNHIFILGNHDQTIRRKQKLKNLFYNVTDYEELQINSNSKIILSHYPMCSWNGMNRGSIMLHGHIHSNIENKINGNRIDVGIDAHPEFRPYHIKEIFNLINENK